MSKKFNPNKIDQYNREVEKQEYSLWKRMREEWDFCDRIHVTKDEYNQFSQQTITEQERMDSWSAIFREEKKMFYGNFVFCVINEKTMTPYRFLFMAHDEKDDVSTFTVFDSAGDLIFKLNMRIDNDTIHAELDNKNPIGRKILQEEIEKLSQNMREFKSYSLNQNYDRAVKQSEKRIEREGEQVLNFVVNVINYAMQSKEVVQINDHNSKQNTSERKRDSSNIKNNSEQYNSTIKSLQRVVYQQANNHHTVKSNSSQSNNRRQKNVDSWKVRGHWRIYTDGKQTWVRPHVKGRKSKSYSPKGSDYQL